MDHLSPSVVGLLRGMLPDGWNHFEDDAFGIRCDGINISSSLSESCTDKESGLRLITANKSIKISSLNPIMNIIKGAKESEKTSVYYFEVFVMSGDCAVGFVPALDNNSYHHDTILHNNNSTTTIRSVSGNHRGHLIHHPDAEFPLLQNNSEQNGETIGCGIIFGAEPTYFFTHNGVRIDMEEYGINSRVSSLQTALVPTVALSNSVETFVRTKFGFHSDTPFLWNGDVKNNSLRIISHPDYGGDYTTSAAIPPPPPPTSTWGGGGGNGSSIKSPPMPKLGNLSRELSNNSGNSWGAGSLLGDDIDLPPPNFTRGQTLSGAIAVQPQQRPAIPPTVEYDASSSFIISDELDTSHNAPLTRKQRRRASMPTGVNNPFKTDWSNTDRSIEGVPSNELMQQQHGSSSALPPLPLKGSQYKTDNSPSVAGRASPLSVEAEISKDSVFGKSSNATEDMELDLGSDFDLMDAKELATELTRATSASGTNQSSVSQLIELCRFKLRQLNDKITSSTGEDFGELLSVHDLMTEAVSSGESWTRKLEAERRLTDLNESSHSLLSRSSSNGQTAKEGRSEALRDIFGLLCHLRGKKEQTRIKAVRSLLSITRRGSAQEQQQILQSGGLSSLLTLFQSSAESPVLMTVSAMNVVYLIPSYTEPVGSIDIVAVVDCLHYLIESSGIDAGTDFDITPAEVLHASVNAMTFVWMNYIEPKICSSETSLDGGALDRSCFDMQQSLPKRRSYGVEDDDVDYCRLLNSFTSLAVISASLDYNDIVGLRKGVPHDFASILQCICAFKACRGLAMKEGVMNILFKWMRSKDMNLELIAANALRDLTVLESSSYTAGWVHAELLHDKNAIADIIEGLSSPNLEVRRCMAEIVSCLIGVPHTRAAIIDAQGIKHLSQVLTTVEGGRVDDSAVCVAVGKSLLNLAICSGVYSNCKRSIPRTKPGCIIQDIMKSGAIESFASKSRLENCAELRFLYSKLIRVVSEASCTTHPLQQLLCDAGVVIVLGKVLSRDSNLMKKFIEVTMAKTNSSDLLEDSLHNDFAAQREMSGVKDVENAIKELREVFRGLCNMFSMKLACERTVLVEACLQFITSGAVKSLLWVVSMSPEALATLDMIRIESRYVCDIRVDSCQALSSLCPVLLSQGAGLKWASSVLSSLIQMLKIQSDAASSDVILTIQSDALQGIVSLAECDALRTRIVDEFMPHLTNLCEHENDHVSDAAMQVCLALGFNAAEIGARWDAYHLGDKYVFTRAFLIQAMVREEIRKRLDEVWTPPLTSVIGSNDLLSLFENLCSDDDTSNLRDKVRKQFTDVYETMPSTSRMGSSGGHASSSSKRSFQRNRSFLDSSDAFLEDNTMHSTKSNPIEDISLHALKELLDDDDEQVVNEPDNNFLCLHQYPLSEFEEEKDWIVQHSLALNQVESEPSLLALNLPRRVNDLLRVYFPSALIREEVVPLHGLRPNASYDFSALCMPAGKYSSFRREGQMVSTFLKSERPYCHCTLGFRNSSFALEFADSLLQTLYLCPAIQGLSFSNEPPENSTRRGASAHEFEGSELIANLVRSLPSSITHLTFDDVLSNNAALALVHNLQSMAGDDDDDTVGSGTVGSMTVGSTKGFVCALAVMNSPYIKESTFASLIETLQTPPRDGLAPLFHSLHTLDLSGNNLGDDVSARVLEMVLLPSSSHNIDRLDLSGNGIKEGYSVKETLEECRSSKPKLKGLNMSRNDLGAGDVASAIVYSLGDVLSNVTCLDLSSNYLTGEVLDRLGGALPFNSRLENLNVSNNRFKLSSVESLISMLDRAVNSSSRLSFLHLNGNSPALTSKLEIMLSHIMIENRKRCISTHFEERSKPGGKASVDESSTGPLSTLSEITFPKFDRGKRNMITVLFSAPLVWKDDRNNYYPIEKLDFEMEKSLLWQCFTEASRNIDLSYENATTDRLQAARTKGCGCLHYSGHGHPTHLTFEDGSGGIHWLEVDQLKDLIKAGSENGMPPFNFVFVSACHSFLAGQTFVDAGVPHVVCCQQEAQLMDNAALSFTRAFYLALAFGRTVKESFDIGKQAVLNSPTVPNANVEMEKFLLLPQDGNHDVAVLDAEPVPEWPLLQPKGGPKNFLRRGSASSSSHETESPEYKLPSLAQGFSGRETDMYHVLNLVLSRRLVNIIGPSGIGRSSLAVALCHYIYERKSTMMFEQIYFVRSTAKRKGRSSPIFSLREQIAMNKKVPIPTNLDLDETVEIILRALRKTKTLLVFERIEALEGADAQDFQFFLGQILAETKDVHVLISSDKSLGLLQLTGVGEDMYELGPLNFRSTVKLFTFCCPHLQSSRERKELLDLIAPETDSLPGDDESRSNEVTEKVMSILGDGIPAKILSVAYQMTVEEFNELKSLRLCVN